MDRSTSDLNFCELTECEASCCPPERRGCLEKRVWDKLKAYEDTGLTPEQVQEMRRQSNGKL